MSDSVLLGLGLSAREEPTSGFFDNAWVIAVLGGVPAGIIANVLTWLVVSRLEQRAFARRVLGGPAHSSHAQNTVAANSWLLRQLQLMGKEKAWKDILVSHELEPLITTVATAYGVERAAMLSRGPLVEEIIRIVRKRYLRGFLKVAFFLVAFFGTPWIAGLAMDRSTPKELIFGFLATVFPWLFFGGWIAIDEYRSERNQLEKTIRS